MRLVVIGHGRSGTTILQNALNTCAQIFLLGEANFYRDDPREGFRARYNAMHRGFRNQITKSTYAPLLPALSEASDAGEYLAALDRYYRWAGEKVALAHSAGGHDYQRLRDWVERARAHCLFVFRRPLDVIISNNRMFPKASILSHVASYGMTARLYLELLRVLPNVRCIIHEQISKKTFGRVSEWLDVSLDGAFALYTSGSAPIVNAPATIAHHLSDLDLIYEGVAQLAGRELAAPPPILQLEQKTTEAARDLPVGRLCRLIEQTIARAETELGKDQERTP